jgi:hypothetical protein
MITAKTRDILDKLVADGKIDGWAPLPNLFDLPAWVGYDLDRGVYLDLRNDDGTTLTLAQVRQLMTPDSLRLDGCTCDAIAGSHRPSCQWAMRS